jgi:hypothetical protein
MMVAVVAVVVVAAAAVAVVAAAVVAALVVGAELAQGGTSCCRRRSVTSTPSRSSYEEAEATARAPSLARSSILTIMVPWYNHLVSQARGWFNCTQRPAYAPWYQCYSTV